MFTGVRDWSLMRNFNREVMGNIITQQCAIYQFKLEETKVNIYGEAAEEKYYDGPFLFNVLMDRGDQDFSLNNEGVQFDQSINFYFLRDDLVEKEAEQVEVFKLYLPAQASDEELEAGMKEIMTEVNAQSMKDMGKVMGTASKKFAGIADGKRINEMVKKLLA